MSKKIHDDWRLEPHVCRSCMGRIASRPIGDDEDGQRLYQCTNCGLEAVGNRASVLCACGLKLNRGGGKLVSAGLQCHSNRNPSLQFPSLFVASVSGEQPSK